MCTGTSNAIPGTGRGLIFLSGDIHVGCILDISCSKPEFEAASLTASGISAKEDQAVIVGTFLDEDFTVAPGIHSTLREVTRDFNFGIVQVVPTGTGAEIVPTLAHEGTAAVAGLDFAALVASPGGQGLQTEVGACDRGSCALAGSERVDRPGPGRRYCRPRVIGAVGGGARTAAR